MRRCSPISGAQTWNDYMVIPTLAPLEIAGKTITADALLTQRKLADYLLGRNAHYVFTAKDNQPTLRANIRLIFAGRGQPDFSEPPTVPPSPGGLERICREHAVVPGDDGEDATASAAVPTGRWGSAVPGRRRGTGATRANRRVRSQNPTNGG